MQLHKHQDEFHNLINIVAKEKHIPESAVERDYFIVFALLSLSQSEFAPDCVFKGGTSLSKCYPGSIERFSEDIDLTKQTDSIYLKKRNVPAAFNPLAPYDFGAWKANFHEAKDAYEHLHEDLLYTDEKQIFTEAAEVFEQISVLMAEIEE